MPGREHEFFKTFIGLLIETFFVEKGIEFEPMGLMTQEIEGEVSAEADESYCIGSHLIRLAMARISSFESAGLEKCC